MPNYFPLTIYLSIYFFIYFRVRYLSSELLGNQLFTWEGGQNQIREYLTSAEERMSYTYRGLLYGNESLQLPGGFDNDGFVVSNPSVFYIFISIKI